MLHICFLYIDLLTFSLHTVRLSDESYFCRVFYICWNSFVIITSFELNNYKLGNRKFGEILLDRMKEKNVRTKSQTQIFD